MRITWNKEAFVTAVGKDRKREQRGDTLDQQSPGWHFKDLSLMGKREPPEVLEQRN